MGIEHSYFALCILWMLSCIILLYFVKRFQIVEARLKTIEEKVGIAAAAPAAPKDDKKA